MDINYPVSNVKIKNSEAQRFIPDFISSLEIKPKIYFEIGSNVGSTAKKLEVFCQKKVKYIYSILNKIKPILMIY